MKITINTHDYDEDIHKDNCLDYEEPKPSELDFYANLNMKIKKQTVIKSTKHFII
jgi:hypothetical protein